MRIASFRKTSLIEYPGKISCIIFLAGCNFRCRFCYVPHLVLPAKINKIKLVDTKEIFLYLRKNKKLIDAVVFTGGEPTINKELPLFIKKIKKMGFLVGIETNGTNPKMLFELIKNKLVDYIAMDIKTRLEFHSYKNIVQKLTKKTFENVKKSINIILSSNIDYEFRTTLVKELHTKEDIIEICKALNGAKIYYLQNFKKFNETLSKEDFSPFEEKEIKKIVEEGRKFVNIKFRG